MTKSSERKRQTQSCDRCRQRKRKCDDGFPCQNCVKAQSCCTFTKTQAKRGPKTSEYKTQTPSTTQENTLHLVKSLNETTLQTPFQAIQDDFTYNLLQESQLQTQQFELIQTPFEQIFEDEELKKKDSDFFFFDSSPFLQDDTDYQWSQMKLKDIPASDWSSLPLETNLDVCSTQQVVFDDERDTFFGSLDLQQLDLLL